MASATAALSIFAQDGAEALLRAPPAFVDLLPLALYACDSRGHVLWFNRRASDMWGRSPRIDDDTELFCGSHRLFFNGKEIRRNETPMAAVLRTGTPVHGFEGLVERPDGSRIWATVHIDPVKDAKGDVVGAINCFVDTSDLHKAHDELTRSERRFDHLYQTLPVGVYACDPNGVLFRYNKKAAELWGVTPTLGDASRLWNGAHRIYNPDGTPLPSEDEPMRRVLATREDVKDFRAILERPDGSRISVLCNLHPIITPDGAFLGGVNCFQDITELKRTQDRLLEGERRIADLIEALPAAIYTTDAEGRLNYYNQAAVELAGRVPQLGSDEWCVTWKLFTPDGKPLAHEDCPMAVALRENRAVRGVEAVAERPDGTRVPFLPFPTPLRDASGTLVGAVNMLVDISERKQAETRQRSLLAELNHRVKNNLQMLYSLLQTSQRDAESVESQTVLKDAANRVGAMAAAQRVLYGTDDPNFFEARDFLDSVCGNIRQTVGHDIDIVLGEVSGTLANDSAVPLALILNELLTNAVKFGTRDDVRGIVTVSLESRGTSFVLTVQDNGTGFDLPETRRRSSGLGLVAGLVRQIGGTFQVERASGARCTVEFPDRKKRT